MGVSGFLISWATRRATLFPGGLLLCAEELGGVFEDEDVAEMGCARPAEVLSSRAMVAARLRMPLLPLISISPRGRTHAMAAADEAVEGLDDVGGEEPRRWACR